MNCVCARFLSLSSTMKSKLLCFLCLFVAIVICRTDDSATADKFFFKDGDRVVFLGDSITEQRLYTTYIEAYTLTRFPTWKLSFRNVGWGGDTSWLRQRAHPDEGKLFGADPESQQKMVEKAVASGLGRDVLPLKPTAITIKFGMNDHSYQPFNEKIYNAYVRSQSQLGKVLKENGARVAFLTPQPIEDKRPDPDKEPKNQSLRKFSDGLKQVATANSALFVDQFDPYMKLMLAARAEKPDAHIGGGDAVHPGAAGQTLMAWAVLKGLGATAMVSRAELAADSKQKLGPQPGCKIENIKTVNGVFSFDRTDDALPMPIDKRGKAALKLAPILDELSRYELKVTGLTGVNYELTIDGESAGAFTKDDLAKGVNLTTAEGPITQQAQQVLKLVFDKNNAYFQRWREVQLFDASKLPGWVKSEVEAKRKAELERLDAKIADLEAQIEAARKIKPHHFELKPVATN